MNNVELQNYLNGIDKAEKKNETMEFYKVEIINFDELKEEYLQPSKLKDAVLKFKDKDVYNCEIQIKGRQNQFIIEIQALFDAYDFADGSEKHSALEYQLELIIEKLTE